MRVTFFSNYLNHHQLPFCQEMQKLTNNEFTFVATTPIEVERVNMGYIDMNHKYEFVLNSYESGENKNKAYELAEKSDIVISGSAPFDFIKKRIMQNKLTFKYSERIYKKGIHWYKIPYDILMAWIRFGRYQKYNWYLLCSSAYASKDYALYGNFINKAYKWGYFPETKIYDIEKLLKNKNDKTTLLWVGRFIELKHPELAINLAEKLKKLEFNFDLNLIGTGDLEDKIKSMIKNKNLDENVHILGAMSPEEVRKYMEKSNIFLFTSDFNEGWGAVLNEAMNSACAVIASNAIGSVPFLIKDGKNALIFKNQNQEDLNKKVIQLINNPNKIKLLGKEAYKTMIEEWNAKVAAERLIKISNELLIKNNSNIFKEGPCSKAKIIKKDGI